MKYNLIFASIFVMVCSCNSLKIRKKINIERDSLVLERQFNESERTLKQRKQALYKLNEGSKNSIEMVANDVFYWHPDSGLQSRKGNVQVKINLELSKHQQLLKLKDTLFIEEKSKVVDHQTYISESEKISKKVVDKSKKLKVYLIFIVVLVLIILLFVLFKRVLLS